MARRFPAIFYNPISIVGAALAVVSFTTILFLTLVEVFQQNAPAYIGIISYVVIPVPLIIGLLLIPVGAWREKRRRAKGLPASRMVFTLDLNNPHQRSAATVFATASIIFLLFTAYGSYRAFEWTESTEFCGQVCHSVMEPEFAAYQHSPHARVKCIDCHVGPGAGWYVRSKLSGAYQVYAVAVNKFPRPIPTPIANLRPAQETCEQCHWPAHFAGEKKVINTYFKSDSANTRWTVALLMKTGGGNPRSPANGIHWHMNIDNEVTYVATDSQRQVIPWVKARNRQTGEETEYLSTESEHSLEDLKALKSHRMDCMDCHNRPSHIYRPPVRIVDASLASNRISQSLPGVRAVAVAALTQEYSSTQAAMDSIPLILKQYYQEQYPDVAATQQDLIQAAVDELKTQFSHNIFPAMRVSWKAYPNNIGHMTDIGCFRCHDDKHVSPSGKVLTKDCNVCHTILYQGTSPVPATLTVSGQEFQHPEDIGEIWKEINCKDCHGGQ